MDKFFKFLKEALGSKNEVSSKRLIAFLAFIMMAIAFLSNLYFKFTIEEYMFKSMEWIVAFGLGTILAEKFTGKKDEPKPTAKPAEPVEPAEEKK